MPRAVTVTPQEVADAYNAEAPEGEQITVRTVRREIDRGNLAAKQYGRSWVIQEADAAEWLSTFTRYARKA